MTTYRPVSQEQLSEFIVDINNEISHHPNRRGYYKISLTRLRYASADQDSSPPEIIIKNANRVRIVGRTIYPLTIRKEDRGNGETSSDIIIDGLRSNIPKDGLKAEPDTKSESFTNAIAVYDSTDVILKRLKIYGEDFTSGDLNSIKGGLDSDNTEHMKLVRRQTAVRIRNCQGVRIEYCYTENIFYSFKLEHVDIATCKRNISHNIISDVFHCEHITNTVIRHNYRGKVLAFQKTNGSLSKIHSDFVQIMYPCKREKTEFTPCKHVTIQDNQDLSISCKARDINRTMKKQIKKICVDARPKPLVSSGSAPNHGVGVQGIFIRSEMYERITVDNRHRHTDIKIIRNNIYNTQHHPCSIRSCDIIKIDDNTCIEGSNNNTSSATEGIINRLLIHDCNNIDFVDMGSGFTLEERDFDQSEFDCYNSDCNYIC